MTYNLSKLEPYILHDFKTESTRKFMSNFNSQRTNTLYQNNLKNIAFFFYIFEGLKT